MDSICAAVNHLPVFCEYQSVCPLIVWVGIFRLTVLGPRESLESVMQPSSMVSPRPSTIAEVSKDERLSEASEEQPLNISKKPYLEYKFPFSSTDDVSKLDRSSEGKEVHPENM